MNDWTFGLSWFDAAALAIFLACWLGYGPFLRMLARGGVLNLDMDAVRLAWMRAMCARESRIVDGQLLGHTINSASFFASANLILIAAVGGVLFGGEGALQTVAGVVIEAPARVLEAKLALIVVCLSRGMLDFIWAIRQLNYSVALIGAAPDAEADPSRNRDYADAATEVLNPAVAGFNRGVRAYYFALAAGAWLVSPLFLALGALAAVALLAWRQMRSPASQGIHRARKLLGI